MIRRIYRQLYWWRTDRRLQSPLRGIKSVVAFGASLGDNLLCSNVVELLHRTGQGPVAILTDFPDLFEDFPVPVRTLRFDPALISSLKRRGPTLYLPNYGVYNPDTDRHEPQPSGHVLQALCRSIGLKGTISLSPILQLSPAELRDAEWARGQVVIHSTSASALWASKNKEWGADRFQSVVEEMRAEVSFIQVGTKSDPPLTGAQDFRGQLSRRQTAAVLAQARVLIGLEGFLMHLARAVNCRAVIIFGGRVAPWQIGYAGQTNLYTSPPCSPCWQRDTCDHERICLTSIAPAEVIAAARQILGSAAGSPPPDQVEV